MNDDTRQAIISAATSKAAELCGEALEGLAKGRRTFVKGKPVYVPFSGDYRANIKALQLDAFTSGPAMGLDAIVQPIVEPHYSTEDVDSEASEEALLSEARALYAATGVAEVERLFANS